MSGEVALAAQRLVASSCKKQGLEPRISDPAVIAKIAAILSSGGPDGIDAVRGKAVEASPTRVDHDVVEDGGHDRPPAAERQPGPGAP